MIPKRLFDIPCNFWVDQAQLLSIEEPRSIPVSIVK